MFGGLEIRHAASVLRPRPWTVAQSKWAAQLLQGLPPGPILELCTGSGQIGLLAAFLSGRSLVAIDINPAAVACARENAIRAGISDRVEVRCAGIESGLAVDETFLLIIADPPWVPSAEIEGYPTDPPLAIDGGEDGLQLALTTVDVIHRHLRPDGIALLQLGSRKQLDALRPELASRALVVIGQQVCPGRGVLIRLERAGREEPASESLDIR